MDSDDEEMRDVSSSPSPSSFGGGGDVGFEEEEEEAPKGVMGMEVTWFQVDLDYEFDAPRWFDLAQEEPPVEAAAAQQWFANAPSYPPSPLIAMMLAEDLGLPSLRNIAATDAVHCSTASHECSNGAEQRIHRVEGLQRLNGWIPCNGASENQQKPGARTNTRCNSSRGSTLMKPTASQLARQKRQVEVKNSMQSKKSVGVRSDRSTMSSNDCTYQSAKRQRLENGHLNKAAPPHQLEFVHKNHEKNAMNRNIDRPTGLPKLKITIPREPELATKLRAERSRILRAMPTNSKQINQRHRPSATTSQVASTRKVAQPLHGADHQYASRKHDDVGSNAPACTSNHVKHLNNVDKKPEDCRDDLFKFKARPVDRKILASKGDVGVFRSAKRNTTVPKEFNLSKGRKGNPAPLSELFNKLSLTAGAHRGIGHQTIDPPNYISTKDCKENMIGNLQR